MRLHGPWGVGSGEDSKEVEVQRNRTRREMETFYRTIQEIPLNSKEPWDREMDYDDSLTPVIPIEQLPDAVETQTTISDHTNNHNVSLAPSTTSQPSNSGPAEPDLELLAMLLKNPELVMALTSGQAGNLPNAETMKLLDAIKAGNSGGSGAGREERIEVSLPSPTPTTNPGMVRVPGSYYNLVRSHRNARNILINDLKHINTVDITALEKADAVVQFWISLLIQTRLS